MSTIAVRAFDSAADAAYVYSTACHATVDVMGGPVVARPVVNALVSAIIDRSEITIATLNDETERDGILGFKVTAKDSTVEFLYFQRSLFNDRRARALKQSMRSDDPDEASAARMALAHEFRIAINVAKALLGGAGAVTLRRLAPWAVMQVLPLAGVTVTVVPRAI